jgi:hypothetical protein
VVAFRRAVGLLEPLVKQFPNNDAMRSELVMTYLVAPPEAFPDDRDFPMRRAGELANGNTWLTGVVKFRLNFTREYGGDTAGAESACREAVSAFASVEPARRPANGQFDLAFARLRLAWLLTKQEKFAPARTVLEDAIRELRPLVGPGEGPPSPARPLLWMAYSGLADVCKKLDDQPAAEQASAGAKEIGFGPGGPRGPFGGMWGGWSGRKDGPPKPDISDHAATHELLATDRKER